MTKELTRPHFRGSVGKAQRALASSSQGSRATGALEATNILVHGQEDWQERVSPQSTGKACIALC